jgi:hypothetical protein
VQKTPVIDPRVPPNGGDNPGRLRRSKGAALISGLSRNGHLQAGGHVSNVPKPEVTAAISIRRVGAGGHQSGFAFRRYAADLGRAFTHIHDQEIEISKRF